VNPYKIILVVLVLLVHLVVVPPSWADRLNLTKSPDYTEVTQAIDNLLQTKDTPDSSQFTPEEFQQELGELKLQKYILETASNWAECRNETGKTLGIYAHKPKRAALGNTLYFLSNNQTTDDDWDCDGVYLPSGTKVAGLTVTAPQEQELTEPLAIKVVDGTRLVAKTNSETGAVEFNVIPAKIFKAGEGNWSIPNLSLADIEAKVPDAPVED
jgi:hypothetical protein